MPKLSGFLGALGIVAAIAAAPPPGSLSYSTEPGVANFLTAVNTINDELKQLHAEKKISPNDFHFASLAKFTNPGNAAVLAKAIQKNDHAIHELREELGRDPTIGPIIAKAGITAEQIIAVDVQPGSEITVYYQ
jgi:hypothetical protein